MCVCVCVCVRARVPLSSPSVLIRIYKFSRSVLDLLLSNVYVIALVLRAFSVGFSLNHHVIFSALPKETKETT